MFSFLQQVDVMCAPCPACPSGLPPMRSQTVDVSFHALQSWTSVFLAWLSLHSVDVVCVLQAVRSSLRSEMGPPNACCIESWTLSNHGYLPGSSTVPVACPLRLQPSCRSQATLQPCILQPSCRSQASAAAALLTPDQHVSSSSAAHVSPLSFLIGFSSWFHSHWGCQA